MLTRLFTIVLLVSASCATAQSLTPQVVGSAGTSLTASGTSIEYTIGEVATTTLTGGNTSLTQGFHQPELRFTSIETFDDDFSFQLFPNPTEQFVNITCNKKENMQVRIMDASGKAIQLSPIFQEQITLDLQGLSAGMYVCIITDKAGKPLQSYSLIKNSAN